MHDGRDSAMQIFKYIKTQRHPVERSPMTTRATCKNPGCRQRFTPQRAGAQYCPGACRPAVYRWRCQPPPLTFWYDGHEPQLSNQPPRRREYRRDGSYVMVTEGLVGSPNE